MHMLVGLRGLVAVDVVGQSTCSGTDSVVDVAGDDRGYQAFPPASLYWAQIRDFEGRWRIVVLVAVGSDGSACQRKIVGGNSAVVGVVRWAAEYHVRCLSHRGS